MEIADASRTGNRLVAVFDDAADSTFAEACVRRARSGLRPAADDAGSSLMTESCDWRSPGLGSGRRFFAGVCTSSLLVRLQPQHKTDRPMTHPVTSTLSLLALLASFGCEKRMDDTATPGDAAPQAAAEPAALEASAADASAADGEATDDFRADLPNSSDEDEGADLEMDGDDMEEFSEDEDDSYGNADGDASEDEAEDADFDEGEEDIM